MPLLYFKDQVTCPLCAKSLNVTSYFDTSGKIAIMTGIEKIEII
jgi:hypothetical protein